MIDIREYTTVPKNFDFELAITENHRVQSNNEMLVVIGITTAVIVIGLTIYVANEQHQERIKYKIGVN